MEDQIQEHCELLVEISEVYYDHDRPECAEEYLGKVETLIQDNPELHDEFHKQFIKLKEKIAEMKAAQEKTDQ